METINSGIVFFRKEHQRRVGGLWYRFKLNTGIIRAITIPELKMAIYMILTEVDSIAEQFKNTNLEAGQRITIVKFSDYR